MPLEFAKMHGAGNDYLVLDARNGGPADPADFARRWCRRRYGVGSDGVILVLDSDRAPVRMRMINPDGSEAGMCGNGLRCLAKFVHDRGLVEEEAFPVETGAGMRAVKILASSPAVSRIEADMGEPLLERSRVPMGGGAGRAVGVALEAAGESYTATCLSMGNPHAVIFVAAVDDFPVGRVGPAIERLPLFPERTNVNFAQVVNRESIRQRTWERGAGETLACGTGACATAVAGRLNNLTGDRVTLKLPGGDLEAAWAGKGSVTLTGEAAFVFAGQIDI